MSRASVLAVDGRRRESPEIDPAQLERIFTDWHPLVWRTLRRLGLSPAEAADATRRVFQDVSRSRARGLRRGRERVVLLALALRHAFGVDRHVASEVRLRPPMARRPAARSGIFARPSTPASAACVDLMDRVLSHMPRPQAMAFILFELEGLSLAEAGEVMSLGEDAARQAVLDARAEFKAIVAALRDVPRR